MKKEYEKPVLFAENFMLAEHITGNCSPLHHATHWSADVCAYYANDPNYMLFMTGNSQCTYNPGDDDMTADDWDGMELDCKGANFMDGAAVFGS